MLHVTNTMNNIFAKKTIRVSRGLGKTLSSARAKKDISLEKAEVDTKVRLKYLEALEKDDYLNMPPDVYNIGFLTRYAEYLGLNVKKCVNTFLEEKKVQEQIKKNKFSFIKEKNMLLNPGNPEKFRHRLKFVVTPQMFVSLLVALVVVGILGYIWFQVKSFAAAPELELNNPAEQIVVSTDTIDVVGKTDPTAILSINDQLVSIDEEGNFKQAVKLNKGINEIEIKAQNKAEKETVKTIKILVVSEKQ